MLIRTMKLILLITKSYCKGLERNIGDVGVEKKTLFDFLNRVLALQIRVYHFGNVLMSSIHFLFILE